MVDVTQKLENHSIRSLKEDVTHLLEIYKEKDNIELLSEKLIDRFKSWLVSYDDWNPGDLIREDVIEHLKIIIDNYEDICSDGRIIDFVLKTYKFERDGTSIDFSEEDMKRITDLKGELEEIFFVDHVFSESCNSLFISRFKNWCKDPYALYKDHDANYDKFGDQAGIMFDYLTKEIAWYCSINLPHRKLVK